MFYSALLGQPFRHAPGILRRNALFAYH